MSSTLSELSSAKVFGGYHKQYEHHSSSTNTKMRFAIFLPPNACADQPVPTLYWLSGLTCTDENFMQKAGAFRVATELGLAIVAPDTSPRGEDVADDDGYDLGQGAGFYVNATQAPWAQHYQMYDYVASELPDVIEAHFPVTTQRAISGHSMGGHGALMVALKESQKDHARYCSASAFSPISNPTNCPWGQKAFTAYLGADSSAWHGYDSCELLKQSQAQIPMLVDQGDGDNFMAEQLKPDALVQAAKVHGSPLELRMQVGYDHSYYFIASFIEDHLRFHARHLMP